MGKEKPRIYSDELAEHESGVRSMVAGTTGLPYQPLRSLEEAKSFFDGTVILEGDDGGQIYVVCPASMVNCSTPVLKDLLADLDEAAWPGNDPNFAGIFFERCAAGSPIAGGMGGGFRAEDIWIHQLFIEQQIDSAIRAVIIGERERLD